MKNCLQMVRDVELRLDRQLTMDEIIFLQWVFNRYQEDNKHLPAL